MGLKEKRLRTVIEDENLAFHINTFKDYCGGELKFEFNWDEWMSDYDGLLNLNGYQIQQFTDALNLVGHDAAAKEAMREAIKTIKIVRTEDPASKGLQLSGGTLTITTAPAKQWDGVLRGREIADYLLENL